MAQWVLSGGNQSRDRKGADAIRSLLFAVL
jgi:hypothetical protein